MAAGPKEIAYWLQDIAAYRRVSRRRAALRQPGQGVDYAACRETVQAIVERLHPRRMRLRVVEVVQATPSAKTFRLVRVDGPLPPFRPGQYVNVFVDVDGVLTSRPYSIASAPQSSTHLHRSPTGSGLGTGDAQADEGEGARGLVELTVRDKPRGFVAPYLLSEVQAGDELETTGPAGALYHEPLIDGNDLVFLAGGSGITPFMSIIREAFRQGRPLQMHLLYGSRTPDDVIYGEELSALASDRLAGPRLDVAPSDGPSLQYALVISEPPPAYDGLTGFLSAALIGGFAGDVTGKTFYICGPNAMYVYCRDALQELGVPAHKIKRELYGPPDDVTQEPGWPEGLHPETTFSVDVAGRGSIRAPAGEPLLNSLERHGMSVPTICRAGECSACRTRLLSGRVYQPAHTGLRESDREHGYIHACVSYPLEDLCIRI